MTLILNYEGEITFYQEWMGPDIFEIFAEANKNEYKSWK